MVRIIEVGPRDGLQNEPIPIPLPQKLSFIKALASAGLSEIEATSFVSPKWVPQLGDAEELWPELVALEKDSDQALNFSALVPNLKGLERALQVGVKRIALFTAASEEFTLKNINMTIEGSLEAFQAVVEAFRQAVPGGWIRGYVSTAFECPYSGHVRPEQTVSIVRRLVELGVDEVSIGDTIGAAVPAEVEQLTKFLLHESPPEKLAYHFHDTRGTALANVAKACEMGIHAFDASAGGLGGCPYAPGAGGNLATEDLVYFLERNAIFTGVNQEALANASLPILKLLGRKPMAKSQLATLARVGALA